MHPTLDRMRALLRQRWFRTALLAVGLGLSLTVIGGMIYRNWSEFKSFSWRLAPLPLAAAAGCLVAAFGLNVLTWSLISRTFGSRIGFWKDLQIYSFSTIVRRLPGSIWQLASRTYLYHQSESSLAVPLWGSLWELIVQMSSASLLMALMLLLSPTMRSEFPGGLGWLAMLVPVAWFSLRPQDVVSLARRISPKVHPQSQLTAQNVTAWTALYVLSWCLGGAILYFLISALAPQSWTMLPVCIGMIAASGVIAALISPLPGGFGIPEVSLVLLLQLYVPTPVAVTGGILMRLWLLVGEAIVALVVLLIAGGRQRWAPTGRNTP
jgi:uncharacterized membrane protein YbhN (UPF0104 family)